MNRGELHVFDRAGLSHRTVHGAFWEPQAIAFHNGRLFLLEMEHGEEEEHEPDCELFGRRLLVLTKEGAVQQSIHLPEDVHDIRCMSFRDVHTREGKVTEAHFYALHGAAVYVVTLVELSSTMQSATATSTGPVSSRLRRRGKSVVHM